MIAGSPETLRLVPDAGTFAIPVYPFVIIDRDQPQPRLCRSQRRAPSICSRDSRLTSHLPVFVLAQRIRRLLHQRLMVSSPTRARSAASRLVRYSLDVAVDISLFIIPYYVKSRYLRVEINGVMTACQGVLMVFFESSWHICVSFLRK